MSTPITENIAVDIEAAINAITTGNGFNQNLSALRRKRIDFSDEPPEDGKVLIIQGPDAPSESQAVGTHGWDQKYTLIALVIDSDSETDSIETRVSKVRDDIRKKLMEDVYRDGNAIDTILGPATPFVDEGLSGIEIIVTVQYRTNFGDPYTKA